jgi:hypothetical protein
MRLPANAFGAHDGRMKKQNNTGKVLSGHLVRLVKRQGAKYLKQGEKILKKLKCLNDSVEIIAREIARQAKSKR